MTTQSARQRLESVYRSAIETIQPGRAVSAGLDASGIRRAEPLHLIAIGKAAHTMLQAAVSWCDAEGVQLASGLCISHADVAMAMPRGFQHARGSHPHPDDASTAAADVLHVHVTSQIATGAQVMVLLSGGTSALLGAPVGGISDDEYQRCCASLLRSGLDIHAHNALRRQLSRWGNGRLGAALHAMGASVSVLAISDVPGDAPVSIGSAPCLYEALPDAALRAALAMASITAAERAALEHALRLASDAPVPAFPPIPHRIVSSNAVAREAVATAASHAGLRGVSMPELLDADVAACAAAVVTPLLNARRLGESGVMICWGGEPVVALPADAPAGGRMQALALMVARALHDAGASADGITLLAAGSDGRDGATDAAGAVVDASSWGAVQRVGADPAALLAAHDSHTALRVAGCLIPAFASGTNVNDLVIGLVEQ